ncbi:MAG: glycerophosphodiester phosphodiesterase family protein [Pseudomonadota bacterium]
MKDWLKPPKPYAIAHRGASAYAPGNTLRAFDLAADLGADFFEVDVRLTADDILVAHHDAETAAGTPVARTSFDELRTETAAARCRVPALDEVFVLAVRRGIGIYADIKDARAAVPTARKLAEHGIERGVIGAFDPDTVRRLEAIGSPYPRAVLVPLGAEPFAYAEGAEIVHLCWERMDRPQDAVTPELLAEAEAREQAVAIWHEEDPSRMAALREMPVFGICSDMPELVHPFRAPPDWRVRTVAHRGANTVAPENTLPAARCAFAAGFDVVELDLQQSSDGTLLVIHDGTLDRTTDGTGPVRAQRWQALAERDAGSWFAPHFRGTPLPRLADMLHLAKSWGRGIYIEVKEAEPESVLATVRDAEMLEDVFFWDHRPERLSKLRALEPAARVMSRRQDFDTLEETMEAYGGPSLIEYMPEDDWGDFERVRKAGIPIMVCYMGRKADVMDRVIAARPDIVNIDDLFLFRERLRAAGLGA